ncbi:MAG: sugar ABC transporter permease [Clostridiaceae bacterium]|jgi:oligogalacturonide transport system permease protein|nr:sugar ABC transporter permease [Clostridiaceae bacterium]
MKGNSFSKRNRIAYLYILPWLIGIVVFSVYPFFISFYYSLCDYNPLSEHVFIGFGNYVKLFTKDPEFYKSLKATLLYTVYTVPCKLLMSLAIALMLNKARKGIGVLRTVYYLPSLFGGSIAVAVLWKIMFIDNGMVNGWLNFFGIPNVSFLGDPKMALPTLSLLEVWQFGSSMVMFLAALKQVPNSLYESAKMDGANSIRRFFTITIPGISPIIFFCIIMQTLNAIQNFTSAFVVTKGGPLQSTYMLGVKLYNDGFKLLKMGYASATSWIIFSIVTLFTVLLFTSSKYWVFYNDEK